jgi:hypothetical protein
MPLIFGRYKLKYKTKDVTMPKPKAATRRRLRLASLSLLHRVPKNLVQRATKKARITQATKSNSKARQGVGECKKLK